MYARARGLGATQQPNAWAKGAAGAGAGVGIGLQTANATGSVLAGTLAGGLAAAAPFTGPAAPFVAAAAGLVAPLTRLINGCGRSCIDASNIANEAESKLKALRDQYLAQPVRTVAMQQTVLQYMDEVFNWLYQACGAIGGAAGQKCISERLVKGGAAPWCPTRVGCDWITTLRDPVANDKPQPDLSTASLSDILSGSVSNPYMLPLGLAAAAAIAFAVGGGD